MSTERDDKVPGELIDELARVLADPEEARGLLQRAGFPPESVPAFDCSRTFWEGVIRAAARGELVDGVEVIADGAAAMFPGNQVLAKHGAPPRNAAEMPASRLHTSIDNRYATITQQIIVQRDWINQPVVGLPPKPTAASCDADPCHAPSILEDARERAGYLDKLLSFDRRRRPLAGLLEEDSLLPPGATMNAVEVPVFIERDEPGSIDELEVGPRSLPLVLRETPRSGPAPLLLIAGDVGTGKTTLIEQTMASLARAAERDPQAPLPVLLTASDLPSWPDLQTSRGRALSPSRSLLAGHRSGWIYLVDAWDECQERDVAAVALAKLLQKTTTRAVIVASRPNQAPRVEGAILRYRVSPWSPELEARFERQWTEVHPEGRILDGLRGNPLTVTLSAAISPLSGQTASRAQLFDLLIEKLFDAWVARRRSGRILPWSEISPAYQELALVLLEGEKETFSRQEVHAVLMRVAPGKAARVLGEANNELGLFSRDADGRYRFLFRPLAEHLAGAGMANLSDEKIRFPGRIRGPVGRDSRSTPTARDAELSVLVLGR